MRFQKLRVAVAVTRAALLIAVGIIVLTAGVSAQSAAPASDTRAAAPAASGDRVAVPEPTPQALAYQRSGTILWLFNTVWALVLPAILLWTGLSARMRDWSIRVGRRWFFVIALYWIVFTILTTAIDLPRVYYESFMREHAYGLSNQTLAKWASDQAAGLGVTLVIGALFLWVPYLLLNAQPAAMVALHRPCSRHPSSSWFSWSRRSGSIRCSTVSVR